MSPTVTRIARSERSPGPPPASHGPSYPRRGRTGARRAVTVLVATGGALAVWGVAGPVLDVGLTVGTGAGAQEVGPGSVALASLVAGLAAVAFGAVLERLTTRARRVWTAVAASVLIASLTGPLGAETTGGAVALGVMHLVVGASLTAGIVPTLALPCHGLVRGRGSGA
jgi:hypothetical protein